MMKIIINMKILSLLFVISEIQLHPFIFPVFLSLFLLWPITKWLQKYNTLKNRNKNPPPSPPGLPILGNLHQLGSLPHRNLHIMARKHGPLMLLHFGRVPILIVSSADAAIEILKTHDITFASRPQYKAFKKLVYDAKNITFSPYGDYWRKLKSILVLKLLSKKRVQSFRPIMEEETTLLLKRIGESEGPVNLSEMFGEFSNDLICRSAFGTKYRELGNEKLLQLLVDLMELLGTISVGDFIPWLGWIDRARGVDKRMDKIKKEMDEFLEDLIQQRVQIGKEEIAVGRETDNLIDILLEIHNENTTGDPIGKESIKSLVMDTLAGGTDTISTALEWTMTELLQHPTVMEKLQNEVREIAKTHTSISEDEIEKMCYMKAVIKETLRCHPPAALLVPRVVGKDVTIKGFDISKGTVVMVNTWSIGKDPTSWDEPEEFRPERFLNSSTEFESSNFGWIPFGAGRRKCPGMTYGMATIELVLANILHEFNWKLPHGVILDMCESVGLTTHRAFPLVALASKTT